MHLFLLLCGPNQSTSPLLHVRPPPESPPPPTSWYFLALCSVPRGRQKPPEGMRRTAALAPPRALEFRPSVPRSLLPGPAGQMGAGVCVRLRASSHLRAAADPALLTSSFRVILLLSPRHAFIPMTPSASASSLTGALASPVCAVRRRGPCPRVQVRGPLSLRGAATSSHRGESFVPP